ncbi:MAG: hypothetical protein ACRDRQ_02165 [Pseudonocardiaceae bacterium]
MEIAGHDVINHVGAAALRIIADRMGLTSGLSWALARRGFVPVHDRGRVLVDTAVLIADGGRVLSDLAMLRDQGELFGPVASDSTLWRGLNEIGERERIRIAPGEGAQHSECTAGLIEPGADVARRWRQHRPALAVRLPACCSPRNSSASYGYCAHLGAADIAVHQPETASNGGVANRPERTRAGRLRGCRVAEGDRTQVSARSPAAPGIHPSAVCLLWGITLLLVVIAPVLTIRSLDRVTVRVQ